MELKQLQEQMQTAFNELKAAGEKHADEVKRLGQASEETKNTIANINAAMDEIKGQIDALGTKMNRSSFNTNQNSGPVDPKAQEKKDAFFKFVKHGVGALTREEKALVADTVGQVLIPADMDANIMRVLPTLTVMRGLVFTRPTSRDRVRKRSITEVTTGWGKLETSATKTLADFESTPTPSEDFIYVEDAYGLVKIGEDELEDADYDIQAFLEDSFARAYATMEDTGIMKGLGHAQEQPEGLLLGTTIERKLTGAAGTFTADDLLKLEYAVKAQYAKNGVYIVNRQIELLMRLMKDANEQYLWQPSLAAGAPSSFNGKPIVNQDDLDGTIASTKEVAVFGDLKAGYELVDRKGSTVQRLNELYIEDGLIGFKFKRRVGGGIIRPDAMRILKVQ